MARKLPVLAESPLPPLYAGWMDQLLAGPIPRETDATCDDCAMLAEGQQPQTSSKVFFNEQTKCCSYIPSLPNFVVGRILADHGPAVSFGRETVAKRIKAGVAVTPLGLEQPPSFQAVWAQNSATLFGQSRDLRCPHYQDVGGGRCGVWKYRSSICATWHCKYVRGAVGYEFWTMLNQLLWAVEGRLAQWCVLQLDTGTDSLKLLFPSPLQPGRAADGAVEPLEHRILWGNWAGREVEFYLECARLVSALDWPGVMTIGGAEVQIRARLVLETYAKLMSEEVPARLKVGAIQMGSLDQDSCHIVSYNVYDPLSVPRQLIEVLGYFDGRRTDEALAVIAGAEGIKLDPALVQKLADFSVLVPVSDE